MKVPCGGFDLDESVFNVDKNSKQLKLNSPISYDYMPEGYPKKGRWSIEWDGNTEGKVVVAAPNGRQFYNFSDMVLSADDLLGATVIIANYPGETFTITSDNVSSKQISDDVISIPLMFEHPVRVNLSFTCVKKDNAAVNGITFPEKGLYVNGGSPRFMMSKETITPMSADFIPKNFNVVFIAETGNIPTSCNVTYDELRGWVENNIPILSIYRRIDSNYTEIITTIRLDSGSLVLKTAINNGFTYNSDGTFSEFVES